MRYKLITNKITKIYEYCHTDIDTCEGITEVGTLRYIVYINHTIHKKYVRDKIESIVSYIDCDYNIMQGSVVNGMTIDKVEINDGDVILYCTYISDKIEIIGKSKEQLEDEMREKFLKELEEIRSKYVYIDVINSIVTRRRCTKSFGDYDNYIPYYVYDYIDNHCDIKNLLLYYYRIKHENENYTKTALDRYALQKMEINYWRGEKSGR